MVVLVVMVVVAVVAMVLVVVDTFAGGGAKWIHSLVVGLSGYIRWW